MSDEDAFHARLDADPKDTPGRLVFADWLDERGDPRAAGYRALGDLGIAPRWNEIFPDWSYACDWHGRLASGVHYLPERWSTVLEDKHVHKSRRRLEDAAALAWLRLARDEQAAILAATPTPATA